MPDTNGASVSRTGMKDAEALEQIDQTTAAATQGNEAETAHNGQVGQTDYAQQSMTQLFPNGLHGEKGRRSGVVQIMLDALGALLIILADYKWDVFILGGAVLRRNGIDRLALKSVSRSCESKRN